MFCKRHGRRRGLPGFSVERIPREGHVATTSIATAWVAVIGTASGAVLVGAASLITAYLQRRWTHDDRVEELKRGAEEAARTSRIESDAAVLRALRPLINELEHQWNRLGGGPEPSAGAVGEPGKEFADAAATFERQFYHGILHDTESHKLVSQLYWCMRNFAMETGLWQMWRGHPGPEAAREIQQHQEARKRLTGEFRSDYQALNRRMAEYVGMHRLDA